MTTGASLSIGLAAPVAALPSLAVAAAPDVLHQPWSAHDSRVLVAALVGGARSSS